MDLESNHRTVHIYKVESPERGKQGNFRRTISEGGGYASSSSWLYTDEELGDIPGLRKIESLDFGIPTDISEMSITENFEKYQEEATAILQLDLNRPKLMAYMDEIGEIPEEIEIERSEDPFIGRDNAEDVLRLPSGYPVPQADVEYSDSSVEMGLLDEEVIRPENSFRSQYRRIDSVTNTVDAESRQELKELLTEG